MLMVTIGVMVGVAKTSLFYKKLCVCGCLCWPSLFFSYSSPLFACCFFEGKHTHGARCACYQAFTQRPKDKYLEDGIGRPSAQDLHYHLRLSPRCSSNRSSADGRMMINFISLARTTKRSKRKRTNRYRVRCSRSSSNSIDQPLSHCLNKPTSDDVYDVVMMMSLIIVDDH